MRADDPDAWTALLDSVLGPDFPYFAVIGNHDNLQFTTEGGYQDQLMARMERFNGTSYCEGELGLSMACNYKGFLAVMTSVGTRDTPEEGAAYLDSVLQAYPNVWQGCLWHKNQHLYQTGLKVNEVGWEVYETCRQYGGIVMTGHEHSYSRTHLMSNYENTVVASTSNTLTLSPGNSFCFVSGLGGKDIRNWDSNANENPWWASCAAEDNGVDYGALFCTFNVNGNPTAATCEFVDVSGRVWDTFNIVSQTGNKSDHKAIRPVAIGTRRTELTLARTEADSEIDLVTGAVHSHASKLTFGRGREVRLTFDRFPLARANDLKDVQLQVMGAAEGAKHPTFVVRAIMPNGRYTQAALAWDVDADDFSADTVWHSPSLVPIAREVAAAYGPHAVPAFAPLTLVVTSDSAHAIYSRDDSACRAPTLAFDL